MCPFPGGRTQGEGETRAGGQEKGGIGDRTKGGHGEGGEARTRVWVGLGRRQGWGLETTSMDVEDRRGRMVLHV